MREWPKTKETVQSLIDKLERYPLNMPVAIYHEPFDEIEVQVATMTDSNYPYDRPDFDYLNLE